jgi:hypothetical protein
MYGAGWLERQNIREYERAARLAAAAGLDELVNDLLTMAEAEWEHERYFRLKAAAHPLARLLRPWPPPPPRAAIRTRFAREATAPPAAPKAA